VGADLIGWRRCELQEGLGPAGFLGKLKMRAYQASIEAQVAPEGRETIKVQLIVQRPEGPTERTLTYPEIRDEVGAFAAGIPACATCPIGGGAPLGCYRYVTYPIDAESERALFDLFAAEVGTEGSIAQRFHREVLAKVPASSTGWHTRRGPSARQGALAELDEPLAHTWGGLFSRKRLDSAQILVAILNPQPGASALVLHAELHSRLRHFAAERGLGGRALGELTSLDAFYRTLADGAAQHGWSIVVDA
jgi:hypothetical protein